jgi:ATP-dependent DNA ligase
VYEEKVDGYRMMARKMEAVVRLISRNGRDHTHRASKGSTRRRSY